jgi:hypothetical protein
MDITKHETQNNKKRIMNVIAITLIQSNVPWNKKKNLSNKAVTKYICKIGE